MVLYYLIAKYNISSMGCMAISGLQVVSRDINAL